MDSHNEMTADQEREFLEAEAEADKQRNEKEEAIKGLDISYLEEAVREQFLKHFPLGYNKKRTALMQGVMRAFAEYVVADKKRLLHGMKRALEEKQRREQADASVPE